MKTPTGGGVCEMKIAVSAREYEVKGSEVM